MAGAKYTSLFEASITVEARSSDDPELNFEIATAAGMFKSVVAVVLIVTSNTISKRLSNGEQGLY